MRSLLRRQPWSSTDPDDTLVQACRSGHPDAFGAIYDRYVPLVFAYAYRMLGDKAAAEDAAHDTLAKAWASLPGYRPGNFRAWLFSIAHHTIIDQRRARQAQPGSLDDAMFRPSSDSTEDAALRAVALSEASDLLAAFPPEQRSIVAMKLSGLKHSEVAAVVGKSEAAVTQEFSRSIRRLAEALEHGHQPAGLEGGSGNDV
jgi:RNA polymerase sigma-70 factor (ECF subfamily)